MMNSIIEAISVALNEEFGDGYKIHMEEIRQGLKEPCFFIQCLNPTHELFLGKRYLQSNQFCIQYFPQPVRNRRNVTGLRNGCHGVWSTSQSMVRTSRHVEQK